MKKILIIFIMLFSLNSVTAFSKASEPDEKSKTEMVFATQEMQSENAIVVTHDFNLLEHNSNLFVQRSGTTNYNIVKKTKTKQNFNAVAEKIPNLRYCNQDLSNKLYFNTPFSSIFLGLHKDVGWCKTEKF